MSSHFLPNAPYPFLSLSDLLANLFCFVAVDLQDERCSPAPQCRILHSNRQCLSQFTAATLPTSACPKKIFSFVIFSQMKNKCLLQKCTQKGFVSFTQQSPEQLL